MRAATTAEPSHRAPGLPRAGASSFLNKVKELVQEARAVDAQALASRRKATVKELDALQGVIEELREHLLADDAAGDETTDTVARMVAKGELIESAAFAQAMKWSRQALSKALASRRVFFLEHHGGRYFPSFYADREHDRHKLEAVTKALGDLPAGAKLQFFLNPRGSLDKLNPLQALKRGKFADVMAAAQGFAQG